MTHHPIKCTYLLEENLTVGKEPKVSVQYEYESGDKVSKNELVDIGQEKWSHKIPLNSSPLKWKLLNYTPDIPDSYWQRRCFAVMFRTIGLLIPMKYQAVRSNYDLAFFNIRFTDDLEVFDGRQNVLAHAYLYHPNNSEQYNGLMEWNDNHFFTPFGDTLPAWMVDNDNYTEGEKNADGTIKVLPTQSLLHIGMHELKHNHGYRHNLLEKTSIMYPYAKKGVTTTIYDKTVIYNHINPSSFKWTDSDIERWKEGYGSRNLISQRLNQMRARRLKARKVPELPYWVAV